MPFDQLQFCYPWRPYQRRVLDAVEMHLDDKRLHIVAAPGAGKTTLGLEVFRLLRKPTLVLSPTRVIRDQWIDRLKDFCATDDVKSLTWVSNSADQFKTLTSITYQALHVNFKEELAAEEEALSFEDDAGLKEDEVNGLILKLKENQIGVLILDEAHHLRSEWWRALEKVCEHCPDLILVSLTATPPYDSQANEWERYQTLCGPIDEEVSIPELVKAGNLCAHQDYVWASEATRSEKEKIKEHDQRVSQLCLSLSQNKEFEKIVLSHPWLNSETLEKEIVNEPKIAISILSFLKFKGHPLDGLLMRQLDLQQQDIPELGRHWWQVLLSSLFFSKTFSLTEEQIDFVKKLKKQLKASELLNKSELAIESSRRVSRSLSLSVSKIQACVEIHELEHRYRQDKLRQVILTDFIRDESLVSEIETGEVNLGAWPIFKAVATHSEIPNEVAMLSGRLSIIASDKLPILLEYIDSSKIKVEPMGNQQQYQKITAPLNQLTVAFTAMLLSGDIKVLVGTRSLLGEGWDAPVINSLILASSIGSFMLTNQMRGRAIRIDSKDKQKVSSVWHLVAIDEKSPNGWMDVNNLKKRFDLFVGLSEESLVIESGFERLDVQQGLLRGTLIEGSVVTNNNRLMRRRFKKINNINNRWKKALTVESQGRVIPSVKTNRPNDFRSLVLKNSFGYLLLQLLTVLAGVSLPFFYNQSSNSNELVFLLIGIGAVFLYKLPQTFSILKIVFRYLPVDGALRQISKALLEAMCRAGFIQTSYRSMKIVISKGDDGAFCISLIGGSFYESSLFSDCLNEILSPIQSPRYLILREGKFLGLRRDDYHAVPMRFAAKKETALIFYQAWCKNVSLSELIYTRTGEGRERLLKAKMKAFSSNFQGEVSKQDRWQ